MSRALRISVDHDVCVGNGTCLRLAPRVFAHNAQRQSEVIDPAGDTEAAVMRAAANCPVGAIRIVIAGSEERLFP